MSRERLFALADRIVADLTTSEGVVIRATDEEKARGQLRTEVFRVLEDETKFEEIDRPGGPPHPQYLLPLRPGGKCRVGDSLPEDAGRGSQAQVPALSRIAVGISGASGAIYGIRFPRAVAGSAGRRVAT